MSTTERQAAPAPDYASDLPADVERCSCDEALALRDEVARLIEALTKAQELALERGAKVADLTDALVESQANGAREAIARKAAEARVRELAESRADSIAQRNAFSVGLATANELLELMLESGLQPSLERRIRAHLAAQPAPTSPRSPPQKSPGRVDDDEPTRTEAQHATGCRYVQEYPALDAEDCPRCAPTSIEAEHGIQVPVRVDKAWRTEAERRVLEASKELEADWLRSCEFSRDMRIVNFARAVLALREAQR